MDSCRAIAVALLLVIVAALQAVDAQRRRAPVSVEFTPPPGDMKAGDEVTTTFGFRALADLQRIEINVAPFRGVAVVSGGPEAVFTDLRKGDAPQLSVRVRLTDSKYGSLALTYVTVAGGQRSADAMTIPYGDPRR